MAGEAARATFFPLSEKNVGKVRVAVTRATFFPVRTASGPDGRPRVSEIGHFQPRTAEREMPGAWSG